MQPEGDRAVITHMRLHRRWASLAACVAAVGLVGCGTSAPVTKPPVNVTITAPTNGATVGVRQVTVTGTVSPANAQVTVGGQPATVRGGAFRRTVWLTGASQSVAVTAQASGYTPAQVQTTVSYSPNLAAQLVASTQAIESPGAAASQALGLSGGSTASALASAVALRSPRPAAKHRASTPATKRTRPTSAPTPAPTTGKPTPAPITSPPVTTPAPAPPPVSAPAPAPVLPSPAEIAARVKQHWEGNCLKGQSGRRVVPYCTCIYTHLVSTGAFKTPSTVNALVRRVNRYLHTGDASHLTRRIMRALVTCASRYPAAQSVGGRTTVTPLSGSSHAPVAPQPMPRLPVGPAPTTTAPTSTTSTTTTSSSSSTGLTQ